MTSFERVLGQATAVTTLQRALERGQVHHAYRFEGPDGVGKTLCALALAQALVCERRVGCGNCKSCELALTLSETPPHVPMHPDIVMIERGLYPPQLIGRTSPETTGISVQQIRKLVLARIGYAPHEGRALCFIIKEAHELTISAANALLKTLEEPTPLTHFVLVTARPGQLLDTVRSRTLAVRFGPLPDAIVERIGAPHGVTADIAALAEGSVSTALALADEDTHKQRQAFVAAAFAAMKAPDLARALSFADLRAEARDELRQQLLYLAQSFAQHARRALEQRPQAAERYAESHRIVLDTLTELESNAQPALMLEAMIAELRVLV